MYGRALVVLLLSSFASGIITPDSQNPVELSRSNAGGHSDYTFNFSTRVRILDNATVTVVFPNEFASGLGLSSGSCFKKSQSVFTSIPCSFSGKTVIWNIGSIDAGILSVGIYKVLNPVVGGGTGYFKVYTKQGQFQQDYSETFPGVGISVAASAFTSVTRTLEGATLAGYSSSLILDFETPA